MRKENDRRVELVSQGYFEILTPKTELQDQLLRIEKAGRICYQSEKGPITEESSGKFIRMILKRGHESVIEHSCLTVLFRDCSRGFTHEVVRHRLASFSQESTRYVDYWDKLKCILPPHRDPDEPVLLENGQRMSPVEMLSQIEMYYQGLREAGWVPEDARQVLPTATKADIVMTANFREWRHVFEQRTQKPAHWEIRGVMVKLLEELKQTIPVIFEDFVQAGIDNNGFKYYEHVRK